MIIKQFTDEALAHFSYAIISEGKMALVDPSRNPMPYYELAEEHEAEIVAVFETLSTTDFEAVIRALQSSAAVAPIYGGDAKKMIEHLYSFEHKNGRPGTAGEPSTGLGLVLCKDFIERNDGQLFVESEEGKGTVFSFSLPVTKPQNVSV